VHSQTRQPIFFEKNLADIRIIIILYAQ